MSKWRYVDNPGDIPWYAQFAELNPGGWFRPKGRYRYQVPHPSEAVKLIMSKIERVGEELAKLAGPEPDGPAGEG